MQYDLHECQCVHLCRHIFLLDPHPGSFSLMSVPKGIVPIPPKEPLASLPPMHISVISAPWDTRIAIAVKQLESRKGWKKGEEGSAGRILRQFLMDEMIDTSALSMQGGLGVFWPFLYFLRFFWVHSTLSPGVRPNLGTKHVATENFWHLGPNYTGNRPPKSGFLSDSFPFANLFESDFPRNGREEENARLNTPTTGQLCVDGCLFQTASSCK